MVSAARRGKLLNVRDASVTQINGNAEINAIKQILGLQHGKVGFTTLLAVLPAQPRSLAPLGLCVCAQTGCKRLCPAFREGYSVSKTMLY